MTAVRTAEDVFPASVLRDYALLADGERGVLLSPHGEIVWMCAPRWHSPAAFSSLLGGRGSFGLCPVDRHVWGGFYEGGTLIFRSRWVTNDAIVECREALVFPGRRSTAVLLRRLTGVAGRARMCLTFDPWVDNDRRHVRLQFAGRGVLAGQAAGLRLRLSGLDGWRRRTGRDHEFGLNIAAGDRHDLVFEIADEELPVEPPNPHEAWRATESRWRETIPALTSVDLPRPGQHSAAVLRGLTSSSGGMVAAATTSLPERAEAGRNYDYRYVWIRDQAFAGQAAAAAGVHDLLDAAVDFTSQRLLEDGPGLRPAYTVDGDDVPSQRRIRLPGYPGGFDLVGNHVNRQFQLDGFGESLVLFSCAAARGRLDAQHRKAAEIAAAAIEKRWQEPDAGIWEIDDRPWTHSRLICVAGLRRWAGADPAGEVGRWTGLADAILADTGRRALHADGHWKRSPDDPRLDGSLLIPPLRGALPADDPRTVATLRAYLHELTEDGYAYRFRQDSRPLGQAEGAFALCGFHVAMALHQQGRCAAAAAWFERHQAACGPARLFAEEYDVGENQLRGNLPQAFVHAAHLEAAIYLSEPRATRPAAG